MVMVLGNDETESFMPLSIDAIRVQNWWDVIQSRNSYFFELVQMRLSYIETSDLYLLLLEMDDCIDDLDTIECPKSALSLRDGLARAVQDLTIALVTLGNDNPELAQMYFHTARAEHRLIVEQYMKIATAS